MGSLSEDIRATMRCLCALGAEIQQEGDVVHVAPVWGSIPSQAALDCGESGSTLRFLLPVAAALGVEARFTGSGRLPERPNDALIEQLRAHGVHVDANLLPLTIRDALLPGTYALPGDISSQYLTGLLLALPHLTASSRIELTTALHSRGYVDLTLALLQEYGVRVDQQADTFAVSAPQHGEGGVHTVEGDWSNAAFWLAATALGGDVRVEGLDARSVQGDREIVRLLERFHAPDGTLRGIDIDCADVPDLVPILAVVAARAQGVTQIRNAARLRLKESDRLFAMCQGLRTLGARVEETEDGLIVRGSCDMTGGEVDACGDHRIAMALAIAASVAEGSVRLSGAQAVDKSYPSFWDDYRALGGLATLVG
jgi:3-phosphoshikimate 1-carboxyvinyltransferase